LASVSTTSCLRRSGPASRRRPLQRRRGLLQQSAAGVFLAAGSCRREWSAHDCGAAGGRGSRWRRPGSPNNGTSALDGRVAQVRVVDPHHPLYGDTFPVSDRRSGRGPALIVVRLPDGRERAIPRSAGMHCCRGSSAVVGALVGCACATRDHTATIPSTSALPTVTRKGGRDARRCGLSRSMPKLSG